MGHDHQTRHTRRPLLKNGMKDENYQALRIVLNQFKKKGNFEQYIKVIPKVAELDPQNTLETVYGKADINLKFNVNGNPFCQIEIGLNNETMYNRNAIMLI